MQRTCPRFGIFISGCARVATSEALRARMSRHSLTLSTVLLSSGLSFCAVSFASPKDVSDGFADGVQAMDAADLNNDGFGDVLAVCGGKHANSSIFAWFEAPGSIQGVWHRHDINPDHPLRSFLGSCALADFDSDGDMDLAVSSDNHSGSVKEADVYVFENPGPAAVAGTWSYHRVTESTQPWHHINDMCVDDMDGDGKPDIICRSLEPNTIHIFFQNSLTDWVRRSIDTGIAQSEGLATGIVDADMLPDIAFTGYLLQSPSLPRTGSYTKAAIDGEYHTVNQNTKEAIGDIDGDGDNDVVISPAEAYRNGGNAALAWYANPGTGGTEWQQHVLVPSTNDIHQVHLADFDDDGDVDIITGRCFSSLETRIYYNDGAGAFGSPQTLSDSRGLYSSTMIDIDGDGDIDITGIEDYAGGVAPLVYENLFYPPTSAHVDLNLVKMTIIPTTNRHSGFDMLGRRMPSLRGRRAYCLPGSSRAQGIRASGMVIVAQKRAGSPPTRLFMLDRCSWVR
ncbi:MAG: hypothetical protein GF410_10730, partial [Chitinivibrionales bacterium]|nr:hypothetical protein [Chitinivibrionales bacterium]